MYTISAPAPISLEEVKKEQEREKEEQEREKEEQKSRDAKRNSFVSLQSDGASIYESAMEDGDEGYGPETDSSDEEDAANYKMVKNDKVIRRGEMATGDPNYMKDDEEDEGSQVTIGARSEPTTIAVAPYPWRTCRRNSSPSKVCSHGSAGLPQHRIPPCSPRPRSAQTHRSVY